MPENELNKTDKGPVDFLQTLGTLLCLSVPGLYFICFGSLLFGIPLGRWHVPLTMAILLVVSRYLNRQYSVGNYLASIAFFGLMLAGFHSLVLSHYDIFYDSRTYHGPAIFHLSQGWNPIYQWQLPAGHNLAQVMASQIESFPKAYWMACSAIQCLTGNVQSAAVINLILLVVSFIAFYAYLSVASSLKSLKKVLFSALIAFNPVVVAQAFSHLIDGVMASSMIAAFLFLLTYIHSGKRIHLIYFSTLMAFVINVKLTAVVNIPFFGIVALVYCYYVKKDLLLPLLKGGVIATVICALGFGFNPYVSNVIAHQNPFHAAVVPGPNNDCIFTSAPESFSIKNRFSKFVISNLSEMKDDGSEAAAYRKSLIEFHYPPSADMRYSGYGPLFTVVFLASLPLLGFVHDRRIWIILAGLFASVFISNASWWARLVPQLWCVPVILLASCCLSRRRVVRFWALFLFAILTLNTAIVAKSVWSVQSNITRHEARVAFMKFKGMKPEIDNFMPFALYRLKEMNQQIPFIENTQGLRKYNSVLLYGLAVYVEDESIGLQQLLLSLAESDQPDEIEVYMVFSDDNDLETSEKLLAAMKSLGFNFPQSGSGACYLAVLQGGKLEAELKYENPSRTGSVNYSADSVLALDTEIKLSAGTNPAGGTITINRVRFDTVRLPGLHIAVVTDDEISTYYYRFVNDGDLSSPVFRYRIPD